MNSLLFKAAVDYFLRRLGEPSTWNGFGLWVLAHHHFQNSQGFLAAFTAAGIAACGLLAVVIKDKGAQ